MLQAGSVKAKAKLGAALKPLRHFSFVVFGGRQKNVIVQLCLSGSLNNPLFEGKIEI